MPSTQRVQILLRGRTAVDVPLSATDTGGRKGGSFWSSPWPYIIGGIAVVGAGTAVYYGTRPPQTVTVGAVGV